MKKVKNLSFNRTISSKAELTVWIQWRKTVLKNQKGRYTRCISNILINNFPKSLMIRRVNFRLLIFTISIAEILLTWGRLIRRLIWEASIIISSNLTLTIFSNRIKKEKFRKVKNRKLKKQTKNRNKSLKIEDARVKMTRCR